MAREKGGGEIQKILEDNYGRLISLFERGDIKNLLMVTDDLLKKYTLPQTPYDRFKIYTPYSQEVAEEFDLPFPINISKITERLYGGMNPKNTHILDFNYFLLRGNIELIVQLNRNDENYLHEYFVEEKLIDGIFMHQKYKFSCGHEIDKLYFPTWPDYGIPCEKEFTALYKYFSSIRGEKRVFVHCLAGVGRTGMFIFYDLMIKRNVRSEKEFFDLFLFLRSRRFGMIQTESQFKFLHKKYRDFNSK